LSNNTLLELHGTNAVPLAFWNYWEAHLLARSITQKE
jgi:hypothetical protein